MSKNEKLVALVAGGFILYELWKRNQAAQAAAGSSSFVANTTSPIPVWAQQLSNTGTTVQTTVMDTTTALLNLPQGPGGSYVDYGQGGGSNPFFGVECLMG